MTTPAIFYQTRISGTYWWDTYNYRTGNWNLGTPRNVPNAWRAEHVRPQSGSRGQDPHSKRWRFRAFAESDLVALNTEDTEVVMKQITTASKPAIYRWRGNFGRMESGGFCVLVGNIPCPNGANQLLVPARDHTDALIRQLASEWTNDEVNWQETAGQAKSTIGTFTRLTRRTAKLLGNTVPTIIKSSYGPKKGRRKWAYGEAKRLLSSPLTSWRKYPALWLEWNFGIAPVARDAAAAVQRLTDVESREAGNPYWEVYMRKTLEDEWETTGRIGPDIYVRPTWNISYTDVFSQRTGVAMHFRIPRWVCGQYGGGQLSPLGTAWAFVPYSWLIDYVLPIGNWLQGMELAQIAPFFVEGSMSRKVTRTRSFGSDFRASAGYEISSAKKSSVLKDVRSDFRRTLMGSFPYSAIFKPPKFDLDPSLYQLSLGLSALVGVMSKIQSAYAQRG